MLAGGSIEKECKGARLAKLRRWPFLALGFRGSGKNYLCAVLLNFVSRNQEDFKGRPRFRQEILKQEVSRGT